MLLYIAYFLLGYEVILSLSFPSLIYLMSFSKPFCNFEPQNTYLVLHFYKIQNKKCLKM